MPHNLETEQNNIHATLHAQSCMLASAAAAMTLLNRLHGLRLRGTALICVISWSMLPCAAPTVAPCCRRLAVGLAAVCMTVRNAALPLPATAARTLLGGCWLGGVRVLPARVPSAGGGESTASLYGDGCCWLYTCEGGCSCVSSGCVIASCELAQVPRPGSCII